MQARDTRAVAVARTAAAAAGRQQRHGLFLYEPHTEWCTGLFWG